MFLDTFPNCLKISKGTLRQILAAFCVSLSIMSVSSAFVWVTPLLERLRSEESEVPMTGDESSWVVSLIELGDLLSTLPAGLLVNRTGRKPLLLATGPMFIFSWVLVLSTRSVEVLYIVRLIQGLALGILFTCVPLYLAEISGPKIRGAMGFFFQGSWYLGNLYEYALGPYVSYQTLAYLSALPPILFVLSFSWLPESPYQHLVWGKEEEAVKSLQWFRGGEECRAELEEAKRQLGAGSRGGTGLGGLVATARGRRALILVHLVGLTYTLSGGTVMFSYINQAFARSGADLLSPDVATLCLGVLVFLSVPLAGSRVDRGGRRPILLLSALGSCLSLIAASLYFYFMPTTLPYLPYISLTFYCILIGGGMESVFPVVQAELFSDEERGAGASLCHLTTTLVSFAWLKLYQVAADSIGLYFIYAVFAAFAALGGLLIYFFMPETKGKTFQQIQDMLTAS